MRVALTGANGAIGQVLRPRLLAHGLTLCSSALDPLTPLSSGDETVHGDLRDPAVVDQTLRGAEVLIHLAGTSVEKPLPEIIENNLIVLHAVYEGAVRHKLRRVVFASSNHAIGMTPVGVKLGLDCPLRPDGMYGLSKVWGEAMGRLYWDKHGIETVCLRIGSALPRPTEPRHLATWLGDDDLEQLVLRAIETPDLGFLVVWGVSANTRSWWDNTLAAPLGYAPRQNAEDYAAEILSRPDPLQPLARRLQGGSFAAHDYRRSSS
jgi:uronate dehydrogenase